MRYENYSYLYPPRPDQAVMPSMLGVLERQGFVAQVKKNGTCNVLAVRPSTGEIKAMNRHAEPHKLWTPDREKLGQFLALPGQGWYVFVAELLHSKVKSDSLKHVNYVHDVLVSDGEYLVGYTQAQRSAILRALFGVESREQTYSHYVIDRHTWVARDHVMGFRSLYDSLSSEEDEGVVLKQPKQVIGLCVKAASNNIGMLKARKKHKNYSF